MKYISRILFALGLVFGLTACTEDALETISPKLPDNGEMSVNLTFAMPDAEAQTRSKVSGEESNVDNIQMVCFDANGGYLGIRDAEVISDNATAPAHDTGKIKGTVPQGTSRIHFIANRGLPEFLNAAVGTPEVVVMKSEELSTIWNDEDHQKVCYWGYHKEDNETAMNSWLNPTATAPQSKVYLIRDRARIVLTYDPTDAQIPVTKIEWLIHNGRERGYLAPAETSWGNTSYYGNSTVEGHTSELVSTAEMNEYTDCGRYSIENDENNFDVAYQSSGTYTPKAQFLFDDSNEEIDNLKAILRVTYTVNGSPKTVYHVLKLNQAVTVVDDQGAQSEVKVLYDIVRTNTYYIKAKLLSPDVAYYETLLDAINGNEFMNADMEVDRSITDISDDKYTLQIKLPTETTSIVFNSTGEQTMDFVFRLVNDVNTTPEGTTANSFEIKWEKDQEFCDEDLELDYNETTKQFTITANVTNVTDHLQSEWIVVKHKATGLTRYIHVYVIDQFKYLGEPTLKSADNNRYVLNFKIPPTESDNPNDPIYPVGLYPIDVKFTTNTLNAYNNTQTGTNYGLFGVAVEGTQKLTVAGNFEPGYNDPISSIANADRTHWYYQQDGNWWDFWFTYSIKSYAQTNNGEVNIYFDDVRSHIHYDDQGNTQNRITDVGLFMEIKYFGKIYSMPVTTAP